MLIKLFLAFARRTNQAKENEDRLVTLKEREEHQEKEVEKKRKDADMRLRKPQAKERHREEEEEERKAKAEENAARARYTYRHCFIILPEMSGNGKMVQNKMATEYRRIIIAGVDANVVIACLAQAKARAILGTHKSFLSCGSAASTTPSSLNKKLLFVSSY